MLTSGINLAQTGTLPEKGHKAAALTLDVPKSKPFADHDGPGEQAECQQQ
jgi:hypothetical protein